MTYWPLVILYAPLAVAIFICGWWAHERWALERDRAQRAARDREHARLARLARTHRHDVAHLARPPRRDGAA